YAADNPIMAIGLYDIAPNAGAPDSTGCAHGYRLRLKISNNEPGVLQLSGARVELMTIDHETLVFELDGGTQPNPFTFESSQTVSPATDRKPTTAIFEVEAVRAAHAPMLTDFDKKQILAEITVLGTDADDKPIAFRPFLYPIDICDRCLTMCGSRLTPEQTREDFAMGQCDDNAGADGRICFDPDC
ncbi:MAG TPA: hypothetical protein VL326_23010, partial [Kofleriaceae bacterium]|nr:hypothetical protein [Kofleriaceae bacterium]